MPKKASQLRLLNLLNYHILDIHKLNFFFQCRRE